MWNPYGPGIEPTFPALAEGFLTPDHKESPTNIIINHMTVPLDSVKRQDGCLRLCYHLVAKSCLSLCHPMDYNLPSSSVQGIFQARRLEWVAIFFSNGSSQPRDWTHVFYTGRQVLYFWAITEAPPIVYQFSSIAQSCPTLWQPMDPSLYRKTKKLN